MSGENPLQIEDADRGPKSTVVLRTVLITLVLAGMFVVWEGCLRPYGRDELVGDYELELSNGSVEYLTLHRDSTFTHRCRGAESTGTWDYESGITINWLRFKNWKLCESTEIKKLGEIINRSTSVSRGKNGPRILADGAWGTYFERAD